MKWVEECRRRIRHDKHVAFLDLLEAADRRAVETDALFERRGVDRAWRHREMLPGSGQIRESQIDHLHVLVLDKLNDVRRRFTIEKHFCSPISAEHRLQELERPGRTGLLTTARVRLTASGEIKLRSKLLF